MGDILHWKINATFLYDYAWSTRLKTMSMILDWSIITFKDPKESSIDRQLALIGTRYKNDRRSKNRLKLISVPLQTSRLFNRENSRVKCVITLFKLVIYETFISSWSDF